MAKSKQPAFAQKVKSTPPASTSLDWGYTVAPATSDPLSVYQSILEAPIGQKVLMRIWADSVPVRLSVWTADPLGRPQSADYYFVNAFQSFDAMGTFISATSQTDQDASSYYRFIAVVG